MCHWYTSVNLIGYTSVNHIGWGAWFVRMTHDSDHWCEWHMNHVSFVHIMHLICIQWIISATPLIDVRMIYTCWDVDISWYMSHHCIMCQWYAFVDIKHKSYDETQIIWWNTNNMKHKSYDVHMIKGGETPLGCLKLQVISRKWATNYRVLLRKMSYKDTASYGSSPPCICMLTFAHHTHEDIPTSMIYIQVYHLHIIHRVYHSCRRWD